VEVQTVLKCRPMATKQKETILMVEDEINSVLSKWMENLNYDTLTI
jgi:hypothetical protein